MITRRFFVSGMLTTAAVASVSQYLPAAAAEPQPYATVYGVGWDLEPIEHVIYEPMSVAQFGGTPAIDKFREVTAFVHAFPVEPMPKGASWGHSDKPISDPLSRFRYKLDERGNLIGPPHDPHGDKELRIFVCDMKERTERNRDPNDIWYFDRPAKEDEKPRWAKYDYVNHSNKLGRDEA